MSQNLNLDIVHVVTESGTVISLYKVQEYYFPTSSTVFTEDQIKDYKKFDEHKDARYESMLIQLKSGKPLSNFKASKYYEFYVEKLKKENPEYLI